MTVARLLSIIYIVVLEVINMKWTVKKLREKRNDLNHFDVLIDVPETLLSRDASIIHVEPVQVIGYFVAREQEILLHSQMNAMLTLPSTRSLKPVQVMIEAPINERYVYPEYDTNADDYEETTIVLEHDYIDLALAVVDTILLNLPLRVVAEDEENEALPSGKDWQVFSEDDFQQKQNEEKSESIDPRFAGLKALLNEDHSDE